MKMKCMSDDDSRRLHELMTTVERRTGAHFALVVTPLSDRYLLFPLIWAAAAALAVGGLLAIFWPLLPLPIGFLIQAGTFASSALIFDWLPLRLLLVPGRIKREHCVGLARREFAARILADHEHRPGMLLFVSLGERHVEILADNALHTCVGEAAWNRAIATFMTAPKPGNSIADGLIGSIEACAATLEMHYPRA
ncbi:MAG: hypothetical protein B7Y12_11220 [Rhizobiales bacterium 24-66-13]|jgi:putative membrane protein|nr:MAG: hypothetical protein B7Z41_00305 [Rhizobiales bacterium 12-66-7]OYX75286.1 MAG: hypothetical protein B7Y95_03115 [Rhizobiales bacterium 32-66-11]OYY89044.1 MAG: hypothetical protein B7Y61_00405 [Rhizobiales bacterium 35-66-30]OYZ76701.1 MAG: hypothetical protein B7Y12_11220 [Rhizobiales bacterium 24-66-13]OZB12167.1 MAG: hypothetical protein B7X67_00645 [Rhizobiales bacterium 39-66-18]